MGRIASIPNCLGGDDSPLRLRIRKKAAVAVKDRSSSKARIGGPNRAMPGGL
jgi:hypothetical protein